MSDSENENVEIVYVDETESDNEPETIEEPEPVEEPEPIKEKPISKAIQNKVPKRKKREMTPERKAILLENLRRGRETASKNRKKKALAKKIKKQEQDDEIDEVIVKSIEKKTKTKQIFNDYEDLKKRYDILNNEYERINTERSSYTEYRGRNTKSNREPKPVKKMDNDNLKPIMEEPIQNKPPLEIPKIPTHKVSLWDL